MLVGKDVSIPVSAISFRKVPFMYKEKSDPCIHGEKLNSRSFYPEDRGNAGR